MWHSTYTECKILPKVRRDIFGPERFSRNRYAPKGCKHPGQSRINTIEGYIHRNIGRVSC